MANRKQTGKASNSEWVTKSHYTEQQILDLLFWLHLHACCCLQNLNESWFASLDKHQHTPFTHFSCPCSLEQVSNFWKIIISFYAFSTFIFLLAPYKRKTFLIVFICSGQKLDTVIYNISDKLSRALKPLALEYFPPGMKLDPNMLLQQKSVGWSVGKSGWKSVTAGAPLRSVLGLVLFNIFINDPEGGAANPQHFGWWDKTGRSERLTASGVFLASTRDLNRFDKWLTETSQCPGIFGKFPRTWQPLWAACAASHSTGNMYFLMLRGSLLCSSLCPLPLVQSLVTTKNKVTPSPLLYYFRCFWIDTHWPLQGSFCKDRLKKPADGKQKRYEAENSQGFLYTGRE